MPESESKKSARHSDIYGARMNVYWTRLIIDRSAIVLLAIVVAASIASCKSQSPRVLPIEVRPTDDAEVLSVVLCDAATRASEWSCGSIREPRKIFVEDRPLAPSPENDMRQIRGDLSQAHWREVAAMARQLVERKSASETQMPALSCEAIRIGPERTRGFHRTLPDLREDETGWCRLYLPGYSVDGRRALVRVLLRPSINSATGYYCVVFKQLAWQIEWQEYAYFP